MKIKLKSVNVDICDYDNLNLINRKFVILLQVSRETRERASLACYEGRRVEQNSVPLQSQFVRTFDVSRETKGSVTTRNVSRGVPRLERLVD